MKEGISYSFLLNIVILFVFVCGAIVSGIFSYYRAFRANTIIINEIEKFEGYNCLSRDSIAKKLGSISYNVPYNVKCKSKYGTPCVTDSETDGNYAVVAYNLENKDTSTIKYAFAGVVDDDLSTMNARIYDDGSFTKEYQFGVYTYMYVDMPVISSFVKIPFFSKTRKMIEFRNIKQTPDKSKTYDYDYIPLDIIKNYSEGDYLSEYKDRLFENFSDGTVEGSNYTFGYTPSQYSFLNIESNRELYKYYAPSALSAQTIYEQGRHECGFNVDWSAY